MFSLLKYIRTQYTHTIKIMINEYNEYNWKNSAPVQNTIKIRKGLVDKILNIIIILDSLYDIK